MMGDDELHQCRLSRSRLTSDLIDVTVAVLQPLWETIPGKGFVGLGVLAKQPFESVLMSLWDAVSMIRHMLKP